MRGDCAGEAYECDEDALDMDDRWVSSFSSTVGVGVGVAWAKMIWVVNVDGVVTLIDGSMWRLCGGFGLDEVVGSTTVGRLVDRVAQSKRTVWI